MSRDGQDRARIVHQRFRERSRERVLSLVDDELIAEHAADPLGPHSDGLERVLVYLRTGPLAGKEVVVCEQPFARYRLARLGEAKGDLPAPLSDEVYRTLEEAEHAIFLLRVEALRSAAS